MKGKVTNGKKCMNQTADKATKEKIRLHEEIERRIRIMEQEQYQFPERFGRKDYLLTALVVLGCLLMLILGAWL